MMPGAEEPSVGERLHRIAVQAAALGLALAAWLPAPGSADVPALCRVPEYLTADMTDFPNAAKRVAADRKLTIVAIGASSTEGTGASKMANAWPARLGEILAGRLPGVEVRVINMGKRSQSARMILDRLERDVAPMKPAIVIWETGTVEAVRSVDPAEFAYTLMRGAEIEARLGVDLILMDPQYARDTARMINFHPYMDAMRQTAGLPDVTLFPRHDIMRHWSEHERMTPRTRDEMTKGNDEIYDCVAQLLAEVIDRGLHQGPQALKR